MVEKELKTLLDEQLYNTLLSHFEWDEQIVQVNHYYIDKQKILAEKNISVRVRHIGSQYLLQIKRPILIDKGLHIKDEYEEELNDIPKLVTSEKLCTITGTNIGDARLVGNLTTERHICQWDEYTTVCLDKNSYLGIVDFELEIEHSNRVDQNLAKLLALETVGFDGNSKGKYSRFFEMLNL